MALREVLAHFGVTFDDAGLKKGTLAIEDTISKLKSFAGALGAGVGLGAIYHFISGLAEEADALNKQAATLGLSIAQLQEWQYAAGLAGVSAEDLNSAFAKLSGGKFDAKSMAKLGVQLKDANGEARSTADVFDDVAENLSRIENPAERNQLAMGVLGKSYAKFIPLLKDGAAGLKAAREEFEAFGGGFTKDFADDAEAYNDNLSRIHTLWKNYTITIVSRILPTLLALSKRGIGLMQTTIKLVKNTKLLETAAIALGLKGLVFLSAKIGPLGRALKMLSGQFFKVILPLLILEDLLVFMAGGDSGIGRLLDKLGGEGTAAKVRAWVNEVWGTFTRFIDDLKNRPLKILDDWEYFTKTLKKDIRETFGEFGELINIAGGMFVTFIDILTGGWENFKDKTSAVGDYVLLMFGIVWDELEGGFVHLAAMIGDTFIEMWNGVISGAQGVISWMGKAIDKLDPSGFGKRAFDSWAKDLDAGKGVADMATTVERVRDSNRLKTAEKYDSIQARLDASRMPDISANTTVNVTVPNGTPAEVANRVGNAAAAGANKGQLRAAKAVLKPGG